jgi:hypothetical protein
MVRNNFVVLDEICHWLKLMYILIYETRCTQGVIMKVHVINLITKKISIFYIFTDFENFLLCEGILINVTTCQ